MRKREEIEEENNNLEWNMRGILEVLLDIRDLLTKESDNK